MITAYNATYVGLGLYLNEIDHEQERMDLRNAEDRVHQRLFGRSLRDMPSAYQNVHNSLSLIELAAQIRDRDKNK